MTRVAKAIIYDDKGYALVLRRSGTHPGYAYEADLPGGVVEPRESYEQGLIRELREEIGFDPTPQNIQLIDSGRHFLYGEKQLFLIQLDHRPEITISWEHDQYQWVAPDKLIDSLVSKDSYMKFAQQALAEQKTS